MKITRIVLVTKKTPYEELLREYGTHGAITFHLKSRGENMHEYLTAHNEYQKSLHHVEAAFPRDVSHTLVERANVPKFLFRQDDLVVAVGPDGLFANLAKYLDGQPVIAVNPLPKFVDGVVMRFAPSEVGLVIESVMRGGASYDEVTLAMAETSEGDRILAVNDFLVGRLDQKSALYSLEYKGESERQSSSGVLVSTGMGSSGWLSSLKAAGNILRIPKNPKWDEKRLVFTVREPFLSRSTSASILFGSIREKVSLNIRSEMAEGGVIFSDGVPEDALVLPAGTSLRIGIAQKRAILVRP